MKKTKLLLFFCFFTCLHFVSAQVTAHYKSEEITTIYSFANEKKNTNFFFPVHGTFPSQNTGFRLLKSSKIHIPKKIKTQFKEGPSLSIRYYTKNITRIYFYLITNDNKKKELMNNINPVDGYGLPGILYLDNIKNLKDIEIQFEVKEKKLPYDFIFSTLDLINYRLASEISPATIFQEKPFNNIKFKDQYKSSPFQPNGELVYFPKSITSEIFKGSIAVRNDGEMSINDLLTESVLKFLEDYPFYDIKKNDKKKFLESSKIVLKKYNNLSKCDLVDSINGYLSKTINDPHFRIRATCDKPKKNTPIYLYEIEGKYLVSAIFDKELQKKIPLGSEILRINNYDLRNKNLSFKKINEELLKNTEGSSVLLDLIKPSGESERISYVIKDKYEIPDNFKPKNLYIKKINDSIAYVKINKVTYELDNAYLNNYDLISQSKGLVLDFRGCTGGDFIAASQFLSYFIGKEFVFFNYGDGRDGDKYPIIVSESKKKSYNYNKDNKVALLVDENTACVAEMIIHALTKYRKETTRIISKDKHTAGALSFAYEVNLPEEVTIVTNALSDQMKIFLDDRIIEDKGIEPDILIDIKSVEDLQPYNDKVLEKAIFNLNH